PALSSNGWMVSNGGPDARRSAVLRRSGGDPAPAPGAGGSDALARGSVPALFGGGPWRATEDRVRRRRRRTGVRGPRGHGRLGRAGSVGAPGRQRRCRRLRGSGGVLSRARRRGSTTGGG